MSSQESFYLDCFKDKTFFVNILNHLDEKEIYNFRLCSKVTHEIIHNFVGNFFLASRSFISAHETLLSAFIDHHISKSNPTGFQSLIQCYIVNLCWLERNRMSIQYKCWSELPLGPDFGNKLFESIKYIPLETIEDVNGYYGKNFIEKLFRDVSKDANVPLEEFETTWRVIQKLEKHQLKAFIWYTLLVSAISNDKYKYASKLLELIVQKTNPESRLEELKRPFERAMRNAVEKEDASYMFLLLEHAASIPTLSESLEDTIESCYIYYYVNESPSKQVLFEFIKYIQSNVKQNFSEYKTYPLRSLSYIIRFYALVFNNIAYDPCFSETIFDMIKKYKFVDIINLEADTDGNTPLHYAAFNQNFDVICTLLKYGADPYKQNNNGQTPLDIYPDISLFLM